ncbi:MAG: sensor histidine kinase [Solirubrobacteraceae bacterium]
MKFRIVWAIGSVAAIAIILFGIPLAIALKRTYRDEEMLRLQRDAIAASRSVDTAASASDRPELPQFAGRIAVYGLTLGRLAGSGPSRGDATVRNAAASRSPQQTAAAGRLVVAIPLFRGERIVNVLRGERNQAAVATRARSAWLRLGAVAAVLIMLAVLAAFGLGRRLARPLESLAAVARRVGAGDFAARAPNSAIAEADALATALNVSSQRIAELVAREREFSANASHQLRTPLAALRLELEAGLLERPEDATLRDALGQTERLETTIATLLAHARDRAARDRYADLGPVLEGLRERWHGRLAAAGRPLRIIAPRPAPPALIGSAVLDEILDVLLDNALRHGAGSVTVSVRPTADALALEVSDQGAGFSQDPEQAFDRGVGAGNGIGLALARSLAHAAGAPLTVTRTGPHPTVTLLVESGTPATLEQPADGRSQPAARELGA